MIIHIDAFTYTDEWDETTLKAQADLEKELAELEEDYELNVDELDEEYYDIIELESPRMPTFEEMMKELRQNPSTLFILWIEDEESGIHKYIMKDTYEHCIGFLEGIRYCGEQTGVHLTPFMDFKTIRVGLMAANTFVEVNKFFDCEVFGQDI